MIASTHKSTLGRALLLASCLLVSVISPPVTALEFECRVPGDLRYLRLELPGRDHLCEVSMTFGVGGERRVMWYADNDSTFCSTKAYELRDKFIDTWEFDCIEWPDHDGIDQLATTHRRILDRQLIALRKPVNGDSTAPQVQGVRAAASHTADEVDASTGLLALQFFFDDGDDLLRILVDDSQNGEVTMEMTDLAALVDPIDGYELVAAYVDSISDSAALTVVTVLSPDTGTGGDDELCEGRQTLRPTGASSLSPISPHRHVCR